MKYVTSFVFRFLISTKHLIMQVVQIKALELFIIATLRQ